MLFVLIPVINKDKDKYTTPCGLYNLEKLWQYGLLELIYQLKRK